MVQAVATSTIVAQAFRYMEMTPVSSLAEDSEEALAAAEQYPNALRMCLEQADWSFASVLRNLSEVAELPSDLAADPDLPHIYTTPGDLVVIRQVGLSDDLGLRWRQGRAHLRANRPGPILLRYTATIENEALLPALFRDCVSLQLAVLLMRQWVHAHTKHQGLRDMLRDQLMQALRADARNASSERYDPTGRSNDWVSEALL